MKKATIDNRRVLCNVRPSDAKRAPHRNRAQHFSEQHNKQRMDFLNEMNAPPVVRTNSDQRNGGDCGDGAEMNAPPVVRTNSDQRNGGDCGDD